MPGRRNVAYHPPDRQLTAAPIVVSRTVLGSSITGRGEEEIAAVLEQAVGRVLGDEPVNVSGCSLAL